MESVVSCPENGEEVEETLARKKVLPAVEILQQWSVIVSIDQSGGGEGVWVVDHIRRDGGNSLASENLPKANGDNGNRKIKCHH